MNDTILSPLGINQTAKIDLQERYQISFSNMSSLYVKSKNLTNVSFISNQSFFLDFSPNLKNRDSVGWCWSTKARKSLYTGCSKYCVKLLCTSIQNDETQYGTRSM